MSARESAIIGEIEAQRAFMGTRAAQHAGEAAELRAALVAMTKERDALKAKLEPIDSPATDVYTVGADPEGWIDCTEVGAVEAGGSEPEPSAGDDHS